MPLSLLHERLQMEIAMRDVIQHTQRNARITIAATALLALFSAAACSKDETTAVQTTPACTSGVSVTSSTGTSPTFTWTPSCTAAGLFVQRVSDGFVMWSLSTTTTQLSSPITFGLTPDNATPTQLSPLVAGTAYRVGLVNSTGVELATRVFTP